MSQLPSDLVTLPTAPYAERPVELALDIEECRTAIWMVRGNITEAAKILKVTPLRLRKFVTKSPYLSAEMQEAKDQLVDIAENVVYDALTDEDDKGRKDTMARYVLTSQGKARGWGSASSAAVKINNAAGGTIVVQWEDGTSFGDPPAPTAEEGPPNSASTRGDPTYIDITPNEAA
jgi:hypothetical protein